MNRATDRRARLVEDVLSSRPRAHADKCLNVDQFMSIPNANCDAPRRQVSESWGGANAKIC
jgi:hypothetical protein